VPGLPSQPLEADSDTEVRVAFDCWKGPLRYGAPQGLLSERQAHNAQHETAGLPSSGCEFSGGPGPRTSAECG
ncbi:uncharacterized protein METZ01_LOCUS59041, partial [marine metagenome]